MIVIAGVLVQNARYILQQWEAEVGYLGLSVVWPMVLSECAAAYRGTRKILPIVSQWAHPSSQKSDNGRLLSKQTPQVLHRGKNLLLLGYTIWLRSEI